MTDTSTIIILVVAFTVMLGVVTVWSAATGADFDKGQRKDQVVKKVVTMEAFDCNRSSRLGCFFKTLEKCGEPAPDHADIYEREPKPPPPPPPPPPEPEEEVEEAEEDLFSALHEVPSCDACGGKFDNEKHWCESTGSADTMLAEYPIETAEVKYDAIIGQPLTCTMFEKDGWDDENQYRDGDKIYLLRRTSDKPEPLPEPEPVAPPVYEKCGGPGGAFLREAGMHVPQATFSADGTTVLYSASNEESCAQRAKDYYETCDYTSVPAHRIQNGQCMITPPEVNPSTKIYQKCNFVFGAVDGSLAGQQVPDLTFYSNDPVNVFGAGDEGRCQQRGQDFRTVGCWTANPKTEVFNGRCLITPPEEGAAPEDPIPEVRDTMHLVPSCASCGGSLPNGKHWCGAEENKLNIKDVDEALDGNSVMGANFTCDMINAPGFDTHNQYRREGSGGVWFRTGAPPDTLHKVPSCGSCGGSLPNGKHWCGADDNKLSIKDVDEALDNGAVMGSDFSCDMANQAGFDTQNQYRLGSKIYFRTH